MTDHHTLLRAARETGLISADDLLRVLQESPSRVRLVDATYPANSALPGIANAVTFDIDAIAAPNALPHTLPDAERFAKETGALGIGNDDFVICYDQSGLVMAASRAWWMFRVFGHDNVAVLDGGLSGWIGADMPVAIKTASPTAKHFKATFQPELFVDLQAMRNAAHSGAAVIYDARPPDRFTDHIPRSQNLPALSLMGHGRRMIPSEAFRAMLANGDSRSIGKTIATCGSGITACAIALALFREGQKDVAVYDGSWTEWSQEELR
jgi:thiosulfate/3-mercaptopyruvate sulfurtransferase